MHAFTNTHIDITTNNYFLDVKCIFSVSTAVLCLASIYRFYHTFLRNQTCLATLQLRLVSQQKAVNNLLPPSSRIKPKTQI